MRMDRGDIAGLESIELTPENPNNTKYQYSLRADAIGTVILEISIEKLGDFAQKFIKSLKNLKNQKDIILKEKFEKYCKEKQKMKPEYLNDVFDKKTKGIINQVQENQKIQEIFNELKNVKKPTKNEFKTNFELNSNFVNKVKKEIKEKAANSKKKKTICNPNNTKEGNSMLPNNVPSTVKSRTYRTEYNDIIEDLKLDKITNCTFDEKISSVPMKENKLDIAVQEIKKVNNAGVYNPFNYYMQKAKNSLKVIENTTETISTTVAETTRKNEKLFEIEEKPFMNKGNANTNRNNNNFNITNTDGTGNNNTNNNNTTGLTNVLGQTNNSNGIFSDILPSKLRTSIRIIGEGAAFRNSKVAMDLNRFRKSKLHQFKTRFSLNEMTEEPLYITTSVMSNIKDWSKALSGDLFDTGELELPLVTRLTSDDQ